MENISVFDMLKIGVGPSSSHTLGPWRAAQQFLEELKIRNIFDLVNGIQIDLYGSLSLTGKGHATDLAILLGLSGTDPVTIPVESIDSIIGHIRTHRNLLLDNQKTIYFDFEPIKFNKEFLPYHANGMKITAFLENGESYDSTFYSIGGGFITKEETEEMVDLSDNQSFPYPTYKAKDLLNYCNELNMNISDIVMQNELSVRTEEEINHQLKAIWKVMLESIYVGCHTEGFLPGGLMVRRRAYDMYQKLKDPRFPYTHPKNWLQSIRKTRMFYREIFKWVSTFAIAVNEVNASLGRVVTAPTNGSAGVIPAVLMFYLSVENHKAGFEEIKRFLLTAGVIGSIFKRNATISAAMGGCQAEIGVSSAMAAGALCELRGGTPAQCLNAAEIAMEHHLGLTCDPIEGLVQIPCIERNSMVDIKAINASELALDAEHPKVSLDHVIHTMWQTAKDMNSKYKETSEGGLAVSVKLVDC
ncbi:MAG: L-serine ammonia-lyase [Ornithobacterium rhinotracheale]|nr:L-serine ammonia-lyase [Ornithobacterium rhinotracheale]